MTVNTRDAEIVEGGNDLSRLETRRAMRLWTWEGSVSTVQGTLTGGAFVTGFALFLGCGDFGISVLAAIPAFVGLLQLFSSYVAQTYGHRKELVRWFSLTSRLLWFPILLIPFVLPRPFWIPAFLFLTLISSAALSVSGPLWTAWITELVPQDHRGRYFGHRNMVAGIVGTVAAVLGGVFLDQATKLHRFSEPIAFAGLFGVACVFGAMSYFLAGASPDTQSAAEAKPIKRESPKVRGAAWAYYSEPFRDLGFRRIMIYSVALVISQSMAGQFFLVNQLNYIKLNNTWLQTLGAVASLASLAIMPVWGYLADKYGNKPILTISTALVVLPPFLWLAALPDGIPGLWAWGAHGEFLFSYTKLDIGVLNTIAGFGWAGVGLTQFNLMIAAAPSEKRTVYVSAVSAVTGLAGGVAPLVGGVILTTLGHVHYPAHGLLHNGYHVLFFITGFLRMSALWLVQGIRETGSNTTGYVLGQLKATKPLGSIAGLHRLSRGSTAQTRQRAAESLGRLKTPVAVEELVHALDDVALPVREQAAVALGDIGDSRAVAGLIQKLTDPSSGIEGVVAQALGKIGDREALPALAAAAQLGPAPRQVAAVQALGQIADPRVTEILLNLLSSPDMTVRLASIRALSERADPRSETALVAQLSHESHPGTVALIADALGQIRAQSAIIPLIQALASNRLPTVRRAIVNAVGSVVAGRDSFYPYLALDAYARDEVVGKILLTIQKRNTNHGLPRVAVRAKQAIQAYARNDTRDCLGKLALLGHLLESTVTNTEDQSALTALFALHALEIVVSEPPSVEELLLAVFLVDQLTHRR